MSLNIGDNFKYLGKKFLDDRESFDTLALMKACTDVPDGFLTYCKEDGLRYEFKESNEENEVTGKWTEFKVNANGGEVDIDVSDCFHIGEDEPEDENQLWLSSGVENTSGDISYDNPIISELFAYIQTLQQQIAELQADVEYLKVNGGGTTPPIEPDDTDKVLSLLLESGGMFLLESGGLLILEEDVSDITEPILLLEDGSSMLLEDGSYILLEQNA